jgi:DNA-binding winged helix-turn-helix (wHTH) protein/Tol biopolymer transport system component
VPTMHNNGKDLYEFGPFRLDPAQRLLLRDRQPVPLQPKAFETLLVLVRNSEKVVLKDELLNAVWADTFVEESNLTQNIFVLRKALGDVDGGRRYIMTVPGRGYRFAETVRVIPDIEVNVPATNLPEVLDAARTHEMAMANGAARPVVPRIAEPPGERRASWHSNPIAVVAVTVLALAAGGIQYRHFSRIPRLLNVSQVTHSGRVDGWGRIFSDGSRLFLLERDGDHWNTMQVATQGGETQLFLSTFHNTRIFGISARNSEMLIGSFVGRTGNLPLWSLPLVGGSPRRLGDLAVDDAEFSPDGMRIAFSRGDAIYLSDTRGSAPQKLAACVGFCQSLAWSPDGQVIRFTQIDENTDQRTLWEVNVRDGSLHPFLPGWNDPAIDCCGRWTSDGKYYIFASVRNNQSEIWALRESKTPLQLAPPQPIQLTHGPFGFGEPLPSRDGRTIYVAGVTERMDLERVDAVTHQVKPLLNGMPVWEMYFSRDGQWLVYINGADDSVWRSRADGSAPQKLVQNTNVLRFAHVRFGPDGKRILLQAGGRGQPSSIYSMSADGGAVTELGAIGHPWIMPDVSPDGQSVVFGPDFETADKSPERSMLSLYNLQSEEKTVIPGSRGLFAAVWSPDGRYLAAYSTDKRVMKIYDFARGRWSELARGNDLTNPYWSADGRYVYLQDLLTPGEPVFRFSTATWRKEPVFSFEEILHSGPQRCLFIGLTPDGSLLTRVTRDSGDLYALGVDLP